MANTADILGLGMQQTLSPTTDWFLPQVSESWKDIATQGTRVAQLDNLGKDWKVIWPFQCGMAGAIEPSTLTGPAIATDPTTPNPVDLNVLQDYETWPGITESVLPAVNIKTITLKRIKGNLYFPSEVMQLAQLKAWKMASDIFSGYLKGFARNIAFMMCNYWFAQPGNGIINALGSFTTGGAAAGTYTGTTGLDVTLDVAGTSNAVPNSFAKWSSGMRVDIFNHNGTTRLNSGPVFVSKVKGLNRTATYPGHVTLYCPNGSFTVANTTLYHIVPRNSGRETSGANYLPTRLEDFFASSGAPTSIFGLNTTSYPELQQVVVTTSMAATESRLQQYLAEREMYVGNTDMGSQPDTWLMSPGIMARFFMDYEIVKHSNAGAAVDLSGGVKKEITYTLFGRDYTFRSERWVPQKHAYLLQMKNNWQVVRPPRSKGTSTSPGFDQGLEFLASLDGSSGIFLHANAVGGSTAGAFTSMLHCPCRMIYDVIPEKFGGWFKFTNLTESYAS